MRKLLIIFLLSCNKPIETHNVKVEIKTYQNSVYHIVMSEKLPNPVFVFTESQMIIVHDKDTKMLSPTVPHIQKIIYSDKNTIFTW